MSIKIELPKDEFRELIKFCQLNKLDINELSKKCFQQGLRIEKYGLLNNDNQIIEKEVIKEIEIIKEIPKIEYIEVIKEIPKTEYVEIIKEVPKVEYVEVIKEVPSTPKEVVKYVDREVIKEVFIEKDVSNFDNFYDKNYVDGLKQKILELENKPPEIKEVIKEVLIEKDVGNMKSKMESLQNTLLKLKEENIRKDKQIEENMKLIEQLKKMIVEPKAVFLNGSNLDKLY